MIDDKQLIFRFKRGSSSALLKIYDRYRRDLLKLAVVLTGDVPQAEDVVQDVFVRFAQSAERIRLTGNLKNYLVTCTINGIRSQRRACAKHQTVGIEAAAHVSCDIRRPEQWAILDEQLARLSKAMAELPYEQREVISLRWETRMSVARIAALQQTAINTVKGRYRYGMEKLRSLLNGKVAK